MSYVYKPKNQDSASQVASSRQQQQQQDLHDQRNHQQNLLMNNEYENSLTADIDSPKHPAKPFHKKSMKISVWQLLTDSSLRKPVYVLFILLITYMFNQVDRYLQGITASNMQKSQGWGPGDGEGWQQDLLVGAVFTIVYLPSGIPMGYIADTWPHKKKYFLAAALFVWSASVVWTGFSSNYVEVMIGRFVLGIAESACTPLAGSIITDFFPKYARTTALGIYNWGIYTGYSLAQGAANAMTEQTSWRTVWYSFGFAGMAWSVLVFFLPRNTNNERVNALNNQIQKSNQKKSGNPRGGLSSKPSVKEIFVYFCTTPSILILFIASLIRNAGGYVWAFNSKNFFKDVRHQSGTQQAVYMQWIPLIGGCFGALFGGFISDKFVKNANAWKRLGILVLSNLVAAPFAAAALILPPPYCYLTLIGSNVIGEMWVGICLALTVSLVPVHMKTTALSIYFFIIGTAGFAPLLVTPFKEYVFGGGDIGYRNALLVLFPGLYVVSSVIFLVAMITLKRDKRKASMSYSG